MSKLEMNGSITEEYLHVWNIKVEVAITSINQDTAIYGYLAGWCN